jgi:hypothetical protein
MTLEQVIADCEEEISDCQIDLDEIAKLLEEYPERKEAFSHEIDDYKKRMDYNRQLAEWLKELAERRKLPEIVHCGDCKHYKIDHPRANGYHCCYRCHNILPMREDDFCSRAEKRYVENG